MASHSFQPPKKSFCLVHLVVWVETGEEASLQAGVRAIILFPIALSPSTKLLKLEVTNELLSCGQ